MAYDLLIKNGRVVDGSGGPSFQADVAVHQGKIVGVGKFNAAATRTISIVHGLPALKRPPFDCQKRHPHPPACETCLLTPA